MPRFYSNDAIRPFHRLPLTAALFAFKVTARRIKQAMNLVLKSYIHIFVVNRKAVVYTLEIIKKNSRASAEPHLLNWYYKERLTTEQEHLTY